MNINVHIERLILQDLPATGSDGPLVQAAVEAELMRLLGEHDQRPLAAAAVPHVSAGEIQLAEGVKPPKLGHQIAAAIYNGLVPTPTPPRSIPSGQGSRT